MDMQNSYILGRVCSTPSSSQTPNGRPMLTFDVAYRRTIKGPLGIRSRSCFAACVAYDVFAQDLAAMNQQQGGLCGRQILVYGHLDKRHTSDTSVTELVIDQYTVFEPATQIQPLNTSERSGRVGSPATTPPTGA